MTHLQHLIKLYTQPSTRFFMSKHEYISELASLAPYFLTSSLIKAQPTHKNENYSGGPSVMDRLPAVTGASLTQEYSSHNITDQSIAFYDVRGVITSDSWFRVSTKQLQRDLMDAESNSKISAHLLYINSGGGEAWYLDQLAHTIKNLQKPSLAFVERVCGSAAYYIASQTDHISAATPFNVIGSIGTMVSFMDIQPMLEKWGIKFIEEYASQSDLKNKKFKDLVDGSPKQFIDEELDPLAEQFINDVRTARSGLAKLDLKHPAFRGETFYANKAIDISLIDSIESFPDAVARLTNLVQNKKAIRSQLINLLTH